MTDAEFDRRYEAWKKKEEAYYSQPAGAEPDPGPPPQPPAGYNGKYKKLFEPGGPHSPLHKNPKGGQPKEEDPLDPTEKSLLEIIRSNYPWLEVIGLGDFVIAQIRAGASIDELIAKVRQTPQYKTRFAGIVRADGTRRFATEAEYLRREQDYRTVLTEFGMFDPNQDSALDYVAFMDANMQPEQLRQRLATYRAIERGGEAIKDAFFVYAGMDVSTDDLYQATVSPAFRQQMISTYDEKVAKQTLDYETWITRATQRGLSRVTKTLRDMRTLGLMTGEAVSQMLAVDPNFAREMMGAIFSHSVAGTRTLALDELLATFDYAMIGSAAREAGLTIPDRERVQQFIDAGVDRARALRGYAEISLRQAGLQSFAARFNAGPTSIEGLEDAFVLGQAPSLAGVNRLYNQERALGQTGAGFGRQVEGDRVVQQGRRLGG